MRNKKKIMNYINPQNNNFVEYDNIFLMKKVLAQTITNLNFNISTLDMFSVDHLEIFKYMYSLIINSYDTNSIKILMVELLNAFVCNTEIVTYYKIKKQIFHVINVPKFKLYILGLYKPNVKKIMETDQSSCLIKQTKNGLLEICDKDIADLNCSFIGAPIKAYNVDGTKINIFNGNNSDDDADAFTNNNNNYNNNSFFISNPNNNSIYNLDNDILQALITIYVAAEHSANHFLQYYNEEIISWNHDSHHFKNFSLLKDIHSIETNSQ